MAPFVPVLLKSNAKGTTSEAGRHFHFVQIDVFSSHRLEGNPLSVFTDARGLSDSEMQGLARETNLQETAFVLPRDAAVEAKDGVTVRIFTPEEEIPFGGHPALGTAAVYRKLRTAGNASEKPRSTITLDLKIGKIPVSFHDDSNGSFGEMQQRDPLFGPVHDISAVASALGINAAQLESDLPIQTVSTGLLFTIVPIRSLNTLETLRFDIRKAYGYLRERVQGGGFYFVSRDTGDPKIGLRARAIFPNGEDPATGAAAGCASAWMVKHDVTRPDEAVLILQGVEIKRPSKLFVRSSRVGTSVSNVRVGGYATPIMEGEVTL